MWPTCTSNGYSYEYQLNKSCYCESTCLSPRPRLTKQHWVAHQNVRVGAIIHFPIGRGGGACPPAAPPLNGCAASCYATTPFSLLPSTSVSRRPPAPLGAVHMKLHVCSSLARGALPPRPPLPPDCSLRPREEMSPTRSLPVVARCGARAPAFVCSAHTHNLCTTASPPPLRIIHHTSSHPPAHTLSLARACSPRSIR